ncbi:MAG: ABC transporter ATP-binding protein [Chloroflexota bacterium]|nr:ABC transporter ATP-binding protein [Chloroflexota bacterium]
MSDLAIETHDLSRRFGRAVAVDGLNLGVRRGETFGLVGPDGAGKTTILRLLAAVMAPSGGWAQVAGHDTRQQAEAIRGQVGYMPQRFSLYGDLTVRENMDFFASIFGVSRVQRELRFGELLGFTGLDGFQNRRAGQLSGGMQKKLGLACTLIHRPAIVLLDEPTTGVDPVSRREFWDILSGLRLEGITVFVSTPYMDEAERCSRVGLLYQGRLVVCDEPARIRQMTPGQLIELRPDALAGTSGQAVEPSSAGAGAGEQPLRLARAAVADLEGVLETQTYGELLHLFVDDATVRLPAIEAALAAHGLTAQGVRTTRPRLEEAFISLVRRQSACPLPQGGSAKTGV